MINNAGYKLLGQAEELQLDTSSCVFSPDRIPGVSKGVFTYRNLCGRARGGMRPSCFPVFWVCVRKSSQVAQTHC